MKKSGKTSNKRDSKFKPHSYFQITASTLLTESQNVNGRITLDLNIELEKREKRLTFSKENRGCIAGGCLQVPQDRRKSL
jgi:hypothetical protein